MMRRIQPVPVFPDGFYCHVEVRGRRRSQVWPGSAMPPIVNPGSASGRTNSERALPLFGVDEPPLFVDLLTLKLEQN